MRGFLVGILFLSIRSGFSFTAHPHSCIHPASIPHVRDSRRLDDSFLLPKLYVHRTTELHLTDRNVEVTEDVNGLSSTTATTTLLDRPLLAIADGFTLLLFAAIGKASHTSSGALDLLATAKTAAPFWLAWYGTSFLTQSYDTQSSCTLKDTALQAVRGWSVAVPLGIILRGVVKGAVPPFPFAVVTMIATLVLLVGVRVGWFVIGVDRPDKDAEMEQ